MIKKEIRHFKLKVGKYTDIDASVPASVLSSLHKAKIIPDPYYGAFCERDILSQGCSFIGEFEIDSLMLGMENLLLSIGGVDRPCVIVINATPVAAVLPESVCAKIDIKSLLRLGKNTVEIRFAPVNGESCAFEDISIYAPVEIISYNKAVIDSVVVRQSEGKESLRLDIEMTSSGYMRSSRAVAILVSPGGSVSYCTVINGKGWMEIKNPGLWKPGYYGSHNLYKLTVNLYSDNELTDTKEYSLGLRTVGYDEKTGRLSISGVPFRPTLVMSGSLDVIKPRETRERCERMLSRIAKCGIDMIYYNGENRYPSEDYLSLCDSLGIGVAVKLITRASTGSLAERELLKRDIARCLDYLGLHPSVIAVVGRPEYRDMITSEMNTLLPSAVYIPEISELVTAPPSMMSRYSAEMYLEESERNLLSYSIDMRGPNRRDALLSSVAESYRMPTGTEEWTYLSGVISGMEAAEAYIASMRSDTGAHVPFGYASEPLPSLSASLLDYSMRLKPMYYYISRYSRPAKLGATVENGKISFYVTNLQTNAYSSKIIWAIINNENKPIFSDAVEFRVEPGLTKEVYDYDASDIIRGHEDEYYLRFFATDAVGVHSETTMLFVSPRRFKLVDPKINVEIVGANNDFTVTVSASAYARAVELLFDPEIDFVLSDNCFDITSDVPVRLKLHTERYTAVEVLKRTLKVYSLYNIGR